MEWLSKTPANQVSTGSSLREKKTSQDKSCPEFKKRKKKKKTTDLKKLVVFLAHGLF